MRRLIPFGRDIIEVSIRPLSRAGQLSQGLGTLIPISRHTGS